jgi:hypothetical protein
MPKIHATVIEVGIVILTVLFLCRLSLNEISKILRRVRKMIGTTGDSIEVLRTRLRKMTDAELIQFGTAARSLCEDPKCLETFRVQLREAREEWRRRHPRSGR